MVANPPPHDYQPATSVSEIMQRYTQGERYFAFTDLEDGADFSKLNLSGAIFDNSFISDANFTDADLKNVSFRNSNVKCNDFSNADLEGAIFQGALIEATCFAGANLKDAHFVGASYYGIIVEENQVGDLLEDLCIPFQDRYHLD